MSLMYAVNALREIAIQLGKKDWNFSVNPCGQNNMSISSWNSRVANKNLLYANSVICNCSYPGDICHVQNMYVFDTSKTCMYLIY